MRHEVWQLTTEEAARLTGGTIVDLAGGNLGVRLPGDSFHLMLSLDMDDESGWVCWREMADGSRCCDNCYLPLGFVRLDELETAASDALIRHRCA